MKIEDSIFVSLSFSINSALNQNGCTENEGDQIKIYFEKMDEKNRQTAASNPRRFESSIPTPLHVTDNPKFNDPKNNCIE